MKVLITDGDQRSSLVVLRALSREGIETVVAGHAAGSLCFRSRHAKQPERYRDPFHDEQGFVADVLEIARRRRVELIVPTTDRTLVPLSRHRRRFEAVCRLAAPAAAALETTLDKDRTLALAESLGVPCPRSLVVRGPQDLDKPNWQEWEPPVVIKPLRSKVWTGGRGTDLGVSYGGQPGEVRRTVAELLRLCPVILQEYCGGEGVGIEALRWDGRYVAFFQHRRLREYPLSGGASTLRESQEVDPGLRAYASKLLDALDWRGVAMIEFKVDPRRGRAVLMEINGRFWGSLALAVASGVNFPVLLTRLYEGGAPPAACGYRAGVRCRHLEGDLLWLKDFLRHPELQQLYRSRVEGLGEFLRGFRAGGEAYDVQTLDDPWPGIVSLAGVVRKQVVSTIASFVSRSKLAPGPRGQQARG